MATLPSDLIEQSTDFSHEIEAALHSEYVDLSRRAGEHRRRAEVLERLAEQARAQAEADERLLNEIASSLGLACQLRIEQLDRRLRGQRLQEIAVEVLAARLDPGETVHYKQWFEWIREEGFSVVGKDPIATFLTQVARSPRVVSAGRRSGLYRLRPVA
jgi:hypothetical protein